MRLGVLGKTFSSSINYIPTICLEKPGLSCRIFAVILMVVDGGFIVVDGGFIVVDGGFIVVPGGFIVVPGAYFVVRFGGRGLCWCVFF